jgi:DNA-binding protein HU-beta
MNKKQLVASLSGSLNLSKADAERTFDTITNTILDALKGDDTVKIAGFGTYKVAKRKARVGRNPRTGEQIQIAASQKVKFLPAKALKEVFNKIIIFFNSPNVFKTRLGLLLYAKTAYQFFLISVSF